MSRPVSALASSVDNDSINNDTENADTFNAAAIDDDDQINASIDINDDIANVDTSIDGNIDSSYNDINQVIDYNDKEIIDDDDDDDTVSLTKKPSPRALTIQERQLKEETIYFAAVSEHEADQARMSALTLSLKRNKAIFTASENKVISISTSSLS